MKKLIDFDAMFDEKLSQYMQENAGKYTEKQWETIIPKLYKSFGDTFIKKINGTPKGYYAELSDEELVQTLREHFLQNVPVSDFLCREIEGRNCPDGLVDLLSENNEELVTVAVNLAGNSPKAFPAYFQLITQDVSEDIKETAVEALKAGADEAKERALELYERGVETDRMLEILSRVKERDDRVFEILLKEFKLSPDDVPMRASYLAAYGDERALPVLMEYIERDEINFLEFQELKYAIEALGGEYTRERDFSEDAYFQEIAAQSQITPDFTEPENKTLN